MLDVMEKRRSSIQEAALSNALKETSSGAELGEIFDRSQVSEEHYFPTLPAFVVAVEVKDAPQYGKGHKAVYALEDIPKDTKFWVWTSRITGIPSSELQEYINKEFRTDDTDTNNREAIQIFLRQGFVLPNQDIFYTNPTDAGRYFNHSSTPNCGPDGTLRDIAKGEELTMDYSFHNNPIWYQEICAKYGAETEAEVAKKYS